jgi:hypothetical protein
MGIDQSKKQQLGSYGERENTEKQKKILGKEKRQKMAG